MARRSPARAARSTGARLNTTLDRDKGTLVYNVEVDFVAGIRDLEVEAHTGRILDIVPLRAESGLSREVEDQ